VNATLLASFLASAIRFATPLALAATGETLVQRSGVVNVGIEGIMLAGALAAFLAARATGSALLGIAAALAIGLLLAALFAFLVLGLGVDQVVCGLGINLLAFGAAGTAYQHAVGRTGSAERLAGLPHVSIPLLSKVPILGPAFFQHEPLAYVTVALVLAVAWLATRSTWGLALRATGDHPLAAEAAGISVVRVRTIAILAGGTFAALAGADLVLAHALTFAEDLTNGRGFMALAIVLFGRWSPGRVALAALFFGAAEALEVNIQAQDVAILGYPLSRARELVLALPYVLTLAVLAFSKRRTDEMPAALGAALEGRS
jgi:simple sugar transport system permease protein